MKTKQLNRIQDSLWSRRRPFLKRWSRKRLYLSKELDEVRQ